MMSFTAVTAVSWDLGIFNLQACVFKTSLWWGCGMNEPSYTRITPWNFPVFCHLKLWAALSSRTTLFIGICSFLFQCTQGDKRNLHVFLNGKSVGQLAFQGAEYRWGMRLDVGVGLGERWAGGRGWHRHLRLRQRGGERPGRRWHVPAGTYRAVHGWSDTMGGGGHDT